MAEQQQLAFLLTFDAETGALKVVRQELEGAGEAAGKAGEQAKGFGAKMSGLGDLAKTVSIGAFFLDALKSAAGASDSLDDLHKTFQETIGVLVRQFEPAIKFVSQGLQGLLVTIQGLGGAIRAVFSGEFSKAAELAADAIAAGGERVQGLTQAIEKDISKIIVQETKIRLDNVKLSAEEKLAIIADGERRAIEALKKSAEFQIIDEEGRALAILEIQKGFSRERESAERAILGAQEKAAEEKKRKAEEAAETERNIQKTLLDEQLDILNEGLRRQLEVLGMSREERRDAIQAAEDEELRIVGDARTQGVLKVEEFEKAKSSVRQAGRRARAAIDAEETKESNAESVRRGNAILAVSNALAQRTIQLAFEAGERGKLNAREVARDIVRTVAQAAASQILAHYATGAAKEVATKGLAGIPIALGLLAKGAAIAAGVAALGGAAVRAIGGGEGGGGGGGGESPGVGQPGGPGGSGGPPLTTTPAGVGGGPISAEAGASAAGGGPRNNIVVNLSFLDGTMAPEAAVNVAAEIAKASR